MIVRPHFRSKISSRGASGFTLVELLVVIAIVGLLVGLLLPAVQAARESARLTQCTNNVKQTMLAFLGYQDAHGGFPNRVSITGTALTSGHGWGFTLLPYMEENALFGQWNKKYSFFDPTNAPVTTTPVSAYLCPSVPVSPRTMNVSSATTATSTGIAGDYVVFHQITTTGTTATCNPCNTAAPKTANSLTSIKLITDGTSHTIMMSEQAGRPDYYLSGVKQATANPTNPLFWGCWASYQSVTLQGWNTAATPAAGGVYAMNRSNSQGVYSFHVAGANFGMCDGSVRFFPEEISVSVMIALGTRDGADQIDESY